MSVDPNEWDFELEQMKPTKKHNIYCNGEIHSFKKRIFEIYDELVRNGETPSVGKIRDIYHGKSSTNKNIKLLDYFDAHIADIRIMTGLYAKGTIEHYVKTRRHLNNFLVSKGTQGIRLSELNRKFIIDFEHYLLTTPNLLLGK